MRVFVAWRRLSARTVDLAEALGARLVLIHDRPPYIRAWLETGRVLARLKPSTVIIQLPQGPLLYRAVRLRERLGYVLAADVHAAMLVYESWKAWLLNAPFARYLRDTDLAIAHSRMFARLMEERGVPREKIIVVYDPLPRLEPVEEPRLPLEPGEYILIPASWHPDEPLEELLRAYRDSGLDAKLVVTGRPRGRAARLAEKLGALLPGYLPRPQYNWLLVNAGLVVAPGSRPHGFLRAAWEAVAAARPLAAPDTPAMREVLGDHPCLYNPRSPDPSLLRRCWEERSELATLSGRLRERLKGLVEEMLGELEARLRSLEASRP